MGVKHINPKEKAESGVILSGEDAEKVFSMFFKTRNKIKKDKFKKLIQKTLKK